MAPKIPVSWYSHTGIFLPQCTGDGPIGHSWSDCVSLPRLCYRRLRLSWAFSLLGYVEGSPVVSSRVMSSPVALMPRNWMKPANNCVSELGNGSASPRQVQRPQPQLTAERPRARSTKLSHSQVPDRQKWWDSMCCFKLSFGVICYKGIDNWYTIVFYTLISSWMQNMKCRNCLEKGLLLRCHRR